MNVQGLEVDRYNCWKGLDTKLVPAIPVETAHDPQSLELFSPAQDLTDLLINRFLK